jgi:hypothetical protein
MAQLAHPWEREKIVKFYLRAELDNLHQRLENEQRTQNREIEATEREMINMIGSKLQVQNAQRGFCDTEGQSNDLAGVQDALNMKANGEARGLGQGGLIYVHDVDV